MRHLRAVKGVRRRVLTTNAGMCNRQASSLLHSCLLSHAQTDGYLMSEIEKVSGRSPPIPLGTMVQFKSVKFAGCKIFGPALSSAVNYFLTRLVEVSGSSLISESSTAKTAAELDHEGLEAVVRGVRSSTKSEQRKRGLCCLCLPSCFPSWCLLMMM